MDAFRKQLDALMGASRNGDVLEVKRNYWDRDVCCLYLTGLCSHDLFRLTDWCVQGSGQLPIVAMSEIFDGYERQYCKLSANLSRKCTSVSGLHGEEETIRINVKNKPTSGTGMLSGATGSTTVIGSTGRIKEAQAYRAQDWGR